MTDPRVAAAPIDSSGTLLYTSPDVGRVLREVYILTAAQIQAGHSWNGSPKNYNLGKASGDRVVLGYVFQGTFSGQGAHGITVTGISATGDMDLPTPITILDGDGYLENVNYGSVEWDDDDELVISLAGLTKPTSGSITLTFYVGTFLWR